MDNKLQDYMLLQMQNLINIPSPTGYTAAVQEYLQSELSALGYTATTLNKGGVICHIGGEGNGIMLAAHVDTLGAVVKTIKSTGHLAIVPLGGLSPNNIETESVTVFSRFNGALGGTIQIQNPSTHVNKEVNAPRTFDGNIEIVLDNEVKNASDVRDLGIENGDFVAFEPRFKVTESGYVKSRFLDDKASAAILLTYAKYIAEQKVKLTRKVYLNFTVYEEVGHGGSCGIPLDVVDMIAVDMGCVGDGLACTETEVSICAKDSGGPYNYALTTELVHIAKSNKIAYAVDIYPFYGSDVNTALKAGYDIRHGLIGPGIFASHGYERGHVKGFVATFDLLKGYIG